MHRIECTIVEDNIDSISTLEQRLQATQKYEATSTSSYQVELLKPDFENELESKRAK